ncbi:UDP-glycosyltransferase 79B9-like [Forsythia ovata]|uniref:UDP-glycosyltransferase 79B9-like n=1 Tax=Forsythia ovata TaxID=205694 RepID=A0ABD1P3B2_9LAMI
MVLGSHGGREMEVGLLRGDGGVEVGLLRDGGCVEVGLLRGGGCVEEFEEMIKGRWVVYSGWVHHTQIFNHPSVGCFVSHCGFGSMWKSSPPASLKTKRQALHSRLWDMNENDRFLRSAEIA